ncbi:hypothetical protein V8F20_007326 [Naviculisporaceae sp. PSN 640]
MASQIIPIWLARLMTIIGLGACLYYGLWGTHINAIHNGFYASLNKTRGNGPEELYIPGGPAPYRWTYTGFLKKTDQQLRILVGFFGAFLHGEMGESGRLASKYLTGQFCAGWMLVSLEGLRHGGLLSWTGFMGLIFQNVAYTNTVPIWLVLHLLISPTAKTTSITSSSVTADPVSAKLLPLCVALCFGIPTVAMNLPSPDILSPKAHYAWVAIWQGFPVWQSVILMILRPFFSSIYSTANPRAAAASVYKTILVISVYSHLSVLLIALIPASAIPASVAGVLPSWIPEMLGEASFSEVFIPALPSNPPSVDPSTVDVIPSNWLAPLAVHFLQWDVYCGNLAVLIWAVFMYYVAAASSKAVSSSSSGAKVIGKTLGWFVVGGPVAAATYLLWERDEGVYRKELVGGKKAI